jgi:hypothetical protein
MHATAPPLSDRCAQARRATRPAPQAPSRSIRPRAPRIARIPPRSNPSATPPKRKIHPRPCVSNDGSMSPPLPPPTAYTPVEASCPLANRHDVPVIDCSQPVRATFCRGVCDLFNSGDLKPGQSRMQVHTRAWRMVLLPYGVATVRRVLDQVAFSGCPAAEVRRTDGRTRG